MIELKLPFAYRFRSNNEDTLSELEESHIYFQNPRKLNDPFDCYPELLKLTDDKNELKSFFQFLEPIIPASEKSKIKSELSANNLTSFKNMVGDYLDKFINKFGIACLSLSPANLMMWSHYSNFHKGICLQYDTSKDENAFRRTRPMNYVDKFEQKEYNPIKEGNQFEHLLYTKSDVWRNEYELRVVKETQGRFPIDRNCLRTIIFGLKTEEDYKQRIFDLTFDKYPNLSYFESEPLKNGFGLTFKQIG